MAARQHSDVRCINYVTAAKEGSFVATSPDGEDRKVTERIVFIELNSTYSSK